MSTANNLINSAAATVIAEIVTIPICTIKTNYQNTYNINLKATIIKIYNTNGIRAFYKATFPAIFSQMISTSSKYTLYRYFEENNLITNKIVASITANYISSLATHPLDNIKVHWQMNANMNLKVIYRGYSKTLIKTTLGAATFFPIYDYLKINHSVIFSSLISSVISTIIVQPVDYLKVRHMYGAYYWTGHYFKGLSLNLLRVVPHFVIFMTFTEYIF